MKQFLAALVLGAVVMGGVPEVRAIGLSASSAILMEAESGRVLYEKSPDEPRLIASITKLMTALVVLECGHDLQEQVKISPGATGMEGSSLYLKPGEQVRLETLLYGLMLHSGNDAAMALAEHCGGDVDHFVEQMNQKARELGMEHSSFANPSGLNQEGHYSTARDMALLARACLAHPELARIVATKSIHLEDRSFVNHNKLLWRYPGCIGMKTGYTQRAGRTLVSAAQREGMTLIAVTLDAPDDWRDHTALLDWGFRQYHRETLYQKGDSVALLPVRGSLVPFGLLQTGQSLSWPLREGEVLHSQIALDHPVLEAPVTAGTEVGRLYGLVQGQRVVSVPLICGVDVPDNREERPQGVLPRLFPWAMQGRVQ